MKTLFILRHAETMPDTGGGDIARHLTMNGVNAAKALGVAMRDKGYAPQFILCSSAERTTRTLEYVLESIKSASVHHDKKIYHATPDDLLDIIRNFENKYDSAMIVGHNPTVHEAVVRLSDDTSPLFDTLSRGYAPGTLSVLACPRAAWSDLQAGENRLSDIINTASLRGT